MTNSELLCELIKNAGYTKADFAEKIGLSRQGLHKKIFNITEFKQTEIEKISRELKLTRKQETAVFFANNVDVQSTGGKGV